MAKRSYAQLIILLIPAAFLAAYLGVCALARQVDLELPLWLKLWSSAFIAGMLHVVIMALVGALSVGVPIERISFGLGKRWFPTSITGIPISFGLPFGGYVRFVGDESNFVGGEPNADPKLLGLRRCEVELSGCVVLLVLSVVILGRHASFDVLALWRQTFEGALSPFDHAQVLLTDLGRHLAGLDDLSIFAVASFGLAALNLLPLPILNGGNAVMYFVSATIYPLTDRAQELLFRVSLLVYLFGCGSWLLALLFLAYDSWVGPLLHTSMLGAPA
jgi:peptidase M50-like protein